MACEIVLFKSGIEINRFRDTYNEQSLIGMINETLDANFQWGALLQGTALTRQEAEVIHDAYVEALTKLVIITRWKRGNGTLMTDSEKQEALMRLVDLLTLLREGTRYDCHITVEA